MINTKSRHQYAFSLCHTQFFNSHLTTLNVLGIKSLFKEQIFGTLRLKGYVLRHDDDDDDNNNNNNKIP